MYHARHPEQHKALFSFIGLIVSGMVGGAIALALFGPTMLLGASEYWNRINGDNAASLIGYYALANDSWRWPLLYTKLINYPNGGNIYYTDAVPLLAIFGKIIFKKTGFLYPYLGAWIFISYILMGIFSYLVFRILNVNMIAAIAGATLFILLPEFIWRHVHIGLIAQFVIVASIYAYIRIVLISRRIEIIAISAITPFIILINAYLFAMCSPIIISGLFDSWRLKKIDIKTCIISILGMIFVFFILLTSLGLIGRGVSLPEIGGFGTFSMNLASPFWPQYSLLSFGRGFLDPIGGQYEGFNYLGLGVLLLFALSLTLRPGAYLHLIARYSFLAATLAALVVFAASSMIYIGPYKILEINYDSIPLINRITSTFRSSGRFFWPVSFIIVICSVLILYRRLGPRYATLLLLAAVIVQGIDISPLFRIARTDSTHAVGAVASDSPRIKDLITSRSAIVFVPGALCGSRRNINSTLEMQLMAARAGRPFDGAYLNRGGASCGELTASFAADPFRGITGTSVMLVAMKEAVSPTVVAYGLGRDVECRESRYAFFCARVPLDEKLSAFGRAPSQPPSLPLNVNLDASGDGAEFLAQGWSVRSPVFRWAEGTNSVFLARLPQEACNEVRFSAEIVPFSYKKYAVDTAEVSLLGSVSQTIRLGRLGQQRIDLILPLDRCIDHLDMRLAFTDLKSPLEVGMNADPRKVTWGFYNYRFEAK
ncbi:DUF6311 domain-containing protein [Xanthobacter pseudotagetidis]|uniref:DUF6311 domain-containing protein n=1 Tax=Xanthobacter pseudotagetidis TaxID=3119911 RepID=UPI00372BE185